MSFSAAAPVKLGILLLLLGFFILLNLFGRPALQEIKYRVDPPSSQPIAPIDRSFSITIPSLGVTSRIVKDVSPTNSQDYQRALSQGVAHALGTKLPGQGGNIFLFAHSSADLWNASRFNSVFYLMHHLQPSEIIKVWYQDQEYDYEVTAKKIVAPSDTSYLTAKTEHEQLTLMTCYPPGTTFKRLIIIAKLRI